jgi:hypothetical protein
MSRSRFCARFCRRPGSNIRASSERQTATVFLRGRPTMSNASGWGWPLTRIVRAGAAALLLPPLCGACTGHGSETHRAELSDFVGFSEADLKRRLGQPDESSGNMTHKFVVYHSVDARYVNPTAGYYYDHDYNVGFGRPPAVAEFNCRVTFVIEKGLVRAYNLAGNGCH